MPWSVEKRGDNWCVVKEGESSPIKGGCHASRSDAIKHQRALYANEPTLASVESNGDPVRIELGTAKGELDAALVASLTAISERLSETENVLASIVDRLGTLTEPVVNVTLPEPQVTVHVPETVVHVNVPESRPHVEVNVPQTPAPVVNVELPATRKTVKFERGFTGSIEGATVEEEVDLG